WDSSRVRPKPSAGRGASRGTGPDLRTKGSGTISSRWAAHAEGRNSLRQGRENVWQRRSLWRTASRRDASAHTGLALRRPQDIDTREQARRDARLAVFE